MEQTPIVGVWFQNAIYLIDRPTFLRCINFLSIYFFLREYQNIVSDHSRAEHFGLLMLSDDEEEKFFEDIDLDKISQDEDEDEDDDDINGDT